VTAHKRKISILLDLSQYNALLEIAQQENRKVSAVIRDLISRHFDERTVDDEVRRYTSQREALAKLCDMRKRIEERAGVYEGNLLAEAREERAMSLIDCYGGK